MSRKNVSDLLVCKAYAIGKPFDDKWPYDLLEEWTGEPVKVCYRAMERANDRGYIEYGTSLRSGWLTEKGQQMIAEKLPFEPDDIEEWDEMNQVTLDELIESEE